jgi:hypothetical protein
MKDHHDWRNSLYIPGDAHFSERGAQLIAERLIREFEGYSAKLTCRRGSDLVVEARRLELDRCSRGRFCRA